MFGLTRVTSLFKYKKCSLIYVKFRGLSKKHPFDTFAMVKRLQNEGFTPSQSKIMMQLLYSLIQTRYNEIKKTGISKEEMQKDEYLFKAELSELRTELQIMRSKDYAQSQQQLTQLSRELEMLAHHKREVINQLKVDLQLDISSHTYEMNGFHKDLDYKTHEAGNKFGLQLSEVRAEIEAMKWESIRKAILMIGVAAVVMTLISMLSKIKDTDIGKTNNQIKSSGNENKDETILFN